MNPNSEPRPDELDDLEDELGALIRAAAPPIVYPPEMADPAAFARKCFGPPPRTQPRLRWFWLIAAGLLLAVGSGVVAWQVFLRSTPVNIPPEPVPAPPTELPVAPYPHEVHPKSPGELYILPDHGSPTLAGGANLSGKRCRLEVHHKTDRSYGVVLRIDADGAVFVRDFERDASGRIVGSQELEFGTKPGYEYLVLVLANKGTEDARLLRGFGGLLSPRVCEALQEPHSDADAGRRVRQAVQDVLEYHHWTGSADDIIFFKRIHTTHE